MSHIPVCTDAVMNYLQINPSDIVFDGTLGRGGHSQLILNALSQSGHLVGCDKDPNAIAYCNEQFKSFPQFQSIHGSYAELVSHLKTSGQAAFHKILIDCGLSSTQLDANDRGFSFQSTGPIDMRMNPKSTLTGATILNTYSHANLQHILEKFGDVYPNKKLIESILHIRKTQPIQTIPELLQIIKKSYFFKNSRKKYINMCTRIFQALRIEVNQELDDLNQFLNRLDQVLVPDGHVVIITFHSTEDRIVKRFFKHHPLFQPLGKVLKPSQEEIRSNSRSRSAKVRGYIFREKPMKQWKKDKHLSQILNQNHNNETATNNHTP